MTLRPLAAVGVLLCVGTLATGCGTGTGAGSDAGREPAASPPTVTGSLRAVCGPDAEIETLDPAADPDSGYDREEYGEGRLERAACRPGDDPAGESVEASLYTQDPLPDLLDDRAGYADADGSTVSWAVWEGDGEWVAVWGARLGRAVLQPLVEQGFTLDAG